jgi:hypothetical protein
MSLRVLALVLVLVMAVPTGIALLLPSRGGDGSRPAFRGLHALWTLVPVVLLIALIALSATA